MYVALTIRVTYVRTYAVPSECSDFDSIPFMWGSLRLRRAPINNYDLNDNSEENLNPLILEADLFATDLSGDLTEYCGEDLEESCQEVGAGARCSFIEIPIESQLGILFAHE